MQVSNRALQTLADALRHHRTILGSRWRRLPAGRQALLVLAHLNNGETYTALAGGFGVGTEHGLRREASLFEAPAITDRDAATLLRGSAVATRPGLPSSRGEFHPPALTDPYVNLSVHTALVVLVTRLWGRSCSRPSARSTVVVL